jgi:hypothetical protein
MDLIKENLEMFLYIRTNENACYATFELKFPTCRKQRFKSTKKKLKEKERFIYSHKVTTYTEGNFIIHFD